ncbi:hypothetical protein [Pseudomonas sp. CF161]|uniref:hypothetical protein n=1 Tax=Pseudomonas sp. CF161 TaxID=911241 RepID=UPI0003553CBA|nr:hypothetical protein [Pseudomonas sp. CF161]EPL09359.1 hypothetical protein CF161_13213 [Pseudomonas sp. CF161]
MSVLQRMVLLIKVLVLLTVGASTAWANQGATHEAGLWSSASVANAGLILAQDDGQDQNGADGQNGDDGSYGDDGADGGNGADGSGADDPAMDDDNDS